VYLHSGEPSGKLVPMALWHLDNPEQFEEFRKVTEATPLFPGLGLPGRVYGSKRPLWIVDVSKDPYFPTGKEAEAVGLRAGFAVPALVGAEVTAVLEFFSTEAAEPDSALLDIMAHVGAQLGRVVERQRGADHRRELENVSRNLEHLYRLSTAVQEPLSLRQQLNRVLEAACQVVAVDRFYKLLLLIGWPLTVGVVVLARGLTDLLRLYPQAEPALAVLGLGIVFMFVNNAWIGSLNAVDRQVAFTWAALASLVVNVGLNLVLIPAHGYLGAAWATVLTEAVLFALGWLLTPRYVRPVPLVRLPWRVVLAGLVMGAVLLPFRGAAGLAVAALVALGAAVFALAAFLLRALDTGEVEMLRRAVGR